MKPGAARAVAKSAAKVKGWFSDDAAEMFGLVDEVQRVERVKGNVFEIGAHHGKSTIVLAHMAHHDERVGVCDIFGDQALNASGSGLGDRTRFEANILEFSPGVEVDIHEKSSLDLTPSEIGGPCRFFHVDGGHLAEEANADLHLASKAVGPGGVIALDDPFAPHWPGVTEGALRFLTEASDWQAFFLGFNKLFLTRAADRPPLDTAVAGDAVWERMPSSFKRKTLPLVGHPLTIFYVEAWKRPRNPMKRALKRISSRLRSA